MQLCFKLIGNFFFFKVQRLYTCVRLYVCASGIWQISLQKSFINKYILILVNKEETKSWESKTQIEKVHLIIKNNFFGLQTPNLGHL